MAGNDFTVVESQLRVHAGRVTQTADALATARTAVSALDPDPTMYGPLLGWLPPLVGVAQELAAGRLRDAEETLHAASDGLTKAAVAYNESSEAAAASLRAVAG